MKFVVALDFSEHSIRALEQGVKFLKDEDQLVLLTCPKYESQMFDAFGSPIFDIENKIQTEKLIKTSEKMFTDMKIHEKLEGKQYEKIIVPTFDPRDEICEQAKKLEADVLVVGSRGLGMLKRLIMGSVSDYCVKNSPCAVFIAK
eukprot:TRINITY_DN17869_c0_g1_i1.p1 TRINITY_DN17869_c0_g1~~TRINITY_DN17869_c0_g1_i1.p1  ORF type:complete len:157 (-),score=21.52 TRINITY_DN17869_c0_g1_i1:70-504(-)